MFQTDATTLNVHFHTDFALPVSATKQKEAITYCELKMPENYTNGFAT